MAAVHTLKRLTWLANEPDRDYVTQVADRVLSHYDGDGPQWQLPKRSDLWEISLGGRAGVVGVDIRNRSCCVKLFYDHRLRTRIRTWLGHAKARRAYLHAQCLLSLGIHCPQPLAYVEPRPDGPPLVLTKLIDDAPRLQDWLDDHQPDRSFCKALAAFLRHMHDQGVTHRDLSPRNLLVRSPEEHPEFLILDYEDTRFHSHVTERQRLDDLHHLHERLLQFLPQHTRLRLLRHYAGSHFKKWCQALDQKLCQSQSKYVRAYRTQRE